MKKGQHKRGGTTNTDDNGGSPAHDGDLQFFGSTGGTQFSTIYSIQYECLGRQKNNLRFFSAGGGRDWGGAELQSRAQQPTRP